MTPKARKRLKEISQDVKTRIDGGHEINSLLRARVDELEAFVSDMASVQNLEGWPREYVLRARDLMKDQQK